MGSYPPSIRYILYLERRRVTGSPPKGSPVIVSCLARSSPSVVVGSDSLTSSPWTAPLTAPEKSGRPPTSILPETAVPVCASVRVTGTETPPVPANPVHVPATLAVGAFAASISACRAAPQPATTELSRTKSTIIGVCILCSSLPSQLAKARSESHWTLVRYDQVDRACPHASGAASLGTSLFNELQFRTLARTQHRTKVP